MNIVFLSDDFPPISFGGAGISTYELALGMHKAGHEVSVITTCRTESEAGELNYNGLRVFRIANAYNARWRAYRSLYNRPVVRQVETILKDLHPDVVHANNVHFYLSYHCLKIAKKYAKAVIFTARDVMTFNFGKLETKKYLENFDTRTTWLNHIAQAKKQWNPLRNICVKHYLAYADKLFAISKALQIAMIQNGIKNVEVIYNGLPSNDWDIDAELVKVFQAKYALQHKKILFFSGRLSASKGGAKVIESLVQICSEVSDTVLLIAGSIDDYAERMKVYATELGVEKHLVFTGWIDREEIKTAYTASDIVLMPSICFDAFGRVNIEAMASQKPVVGTCYGGTPEVVLDNVTGYIVNPLHPEDMAEKVIDLLKNPTKAKQFGEAGYERVKKVFNLEDKINEYIIAYKSVMREKPF